MTDPNPRPNVYRFDRTYIRRARHGMHVQFGRSINAVSGAFVDHFELSAPGYTLTNNGPELDDVEVTNER